MSLHFKHLFHSFITIAEDLNRARAIRLSQSSVNKITIVTNENLRVSQIFLVLKRLFAKVYVFFFVTHDLTNGTIAACRIYYWLSLTFGLVACDRAVASLRVQLKAPGRVNLLWLWIQPPYIDLGILTARDETRVVFEPNNTFDWLLVHHELKVWGDGSSEEPVDPDVLIVLASE